MARPPIESNNTQHTSSPFELSTWQRFVRWARQLLDRPPAWLTLLATLAFVAVVFGTFYRAARVYHPPGKETVRFGLCDFHNAVYFPGKAYLNGDNPYLSEYAQSYPVNREMSPYSPLLLPFAAMFGGLPLRVAEVSWCVLNVAMTLILANWVRFALGWPRNYTVCVGVAALLVASRAGHSNLILGQFAAIMAVATCNAIYHAKSRPWLSALGLCVACIKPTYGLPLLLYMTARRQYKSVVLGTVLSVAGALLAFSWLIGQDGGLGASLQSSHDAIVVDPDVAPTSAWMRTDLLSVPTRWMRWTVGAPVELLAMGILLAPVCWLAFRDSAGATAAESDSTSGDAPRPWPDLGEAVILAMIPLVIYHLIYDCLVVTPVIAALLAGRGSLHRLSPWWRRGLAAICLVIPTTNYLATWSMMEALNLHGVLRDAIVAVNPCALAVAAVILITAWWRAEPAEGS